jgi:[acyl-carrier-protein] S-malonyltransferase
VTVVIVAPGQGSQTPGFLDPWLAESRFATHLEELSDAAGVDLGRHGTVSDADTIRDTAVAQPLIVGASLISLAAVLDGGRRDKIAGIAGHSVGEVATAAGAGILGEAVAMLFVAARGRALADAAART